MKIGTGFSETIKKNEDMRQQVEIHVMAGQDALARYHLNWDAALREEFSYAGGGVWCSTGRYEVGYDDDAAEYLKKFAEERLKEYGITDFYVCIEEIKD